MQRTSRGVAGADTLTDAGGAILAAFVGRPKPPSLCAQPYCRAPLSRRQCRAISAASLALHCRPIRAVVAQRSPLAVAARSGVPFARENDNGSDSHYRFLRAPPRHRGVPCPDHAQSLMSSTGVMSGSCWPSATCSLGITAVPTAKNSIVWLPQPWLFSWSLTSTMPEHAVADLLGLLLHALHRQLARVVERLGVLLELDVLTGLLERLHHPAVGDVVDAATHHHARPGACRSASASRRPGLRGRW